MTEDNKNTIGDFQFGLASPEDHARFTESLYRELEPLREWGTINSELTYWDVADAIMDTIVNYAGTGPIEATELPTLISDALEQLQYNENTSFEPTDPADKEITGKVL